MEKILHYALTVNGFCDILKIDKYMRKEGTECSWKFQKTL